MTPQSRAVVVQKNGKRIPSKNNNIELDPLFIYFFMLKVTWINKHKHSKSEKASHMIWQQFTKGLNKDTSKTFAAFMSWIALCLFIAGVGRCGGLAA